MCKESHQNHTQRVVMSGEPEAGPSTRKTDTANNVEEIQHSMNFNELPQEIISRVFEFLPYSNLKSSRLVCQKWNTASMAPALLDREILLCKQKNYQKILSTLEKSTRPFRHIHLMGTYNDGNYHWSNWSDIFKGAFRTNFGPKMRSLKLSACKVNIANFMEVLPFCQILRNITIEDCTILSDDESLNEYNDIIYDDMPHLINTVSLVYNKHENSHNFCFPCLHTRDEFLQQILLSCPSLDRVLIEANCSFL